MSTEFVSEVSKDMVEAGYVANDAREQATFDEKMKQREERRKQLDDLCMQSMEAMGAAMECVQRVMVESDLSIQQIVDLSEQAAKLGSSMVSMRMNMVGIGYRYAV